MCIIGWLAVEAAARIFIAAFGFSTVYTIVLIDYVVFLTWYGWWFKSPSKPVPVINYTSCFYIQKKITPSCRHRCAVEQRCINGDGPSQWRTAKFERHGIYTPEQIDENGTVVCVQDSTTVWDFIQIRSRGASGQMREIWFFFLICIFNFYLSGVVSMIIADKKQN